MTVMELIEELKKYPPDALVEAYEGERTGVRVDSPTEEEVPGVPKTLGFIQVVSS